MSWGDDYDVRTDYYKSDPAYTWYERQAKRMGRKLNLSHLSDTECRQILDVIQRDYQIRQKEKQRLSKLSKEVHEEEQKRVVLSRQQQFNEKYCICCFSSFGLIFRKRIKCSNCEFFACKDCMAKVEKVEEANKDKDSTMCLGCMQQRELQVQACEWFYGQIKSRFRRFGSAKVVRSLYKRNSEGSDSGGEQSNSDSGVDQQLSPPPASFAMPDDPSVLFMGQQGFVLVSNKQTNTDDSAVSEICIEEEAKPVWRHSPSAANTATVGTQAPQDANSRDLYARLHPEGEVEGPIAATYGEDVASARIVKVGDEEDGARAFLEQLGRTRMDEVDGTEYGDEEGCDNFHMRRKRDHPDVVILSPDDYKNADDSSRKVKFDETPQIVHPEDGDKLQSSSIPYRILSPNDDMSSPECAERGDDLKVKGQKSDSNRMSGDGADKDYDEDEDDIDSLHKERNCGKFYPGDANYQEGAEGLSPRDFDSGIHMSYCLSLDDGKDSEHIRSSSQECLLSPESRKPSLLHSRNSDSLDSFSSMSIHSLDANDTVDSLETHYNSGHSEINSPDINEDFESGASTLVGREEPVSDDEDDDCNSVEIETMSLSRSSSEETLKTENEEDEREQELILADFLDQLQDRSSSMSSELNEARSNNNDSDFDRDNNLDLSQFVPNGSKNRASESSSSRMLHRCNSQPEFNSREDINSFEEHKHRETRSYHSKPHKSSNVYKRSKSSDDFRYSHHKKPEDRDFHHLPIGNMAEDTEAGDTIGDMHQMQEKTSPTNRFIRYDSLPLVVEVCEAEYTSPTHQVSDFRRLSIEYGTYDTEASDRSRKHRNRRMDWQRKFSPKNSYEENEARQPSVESTTTEDTLPKSTSLSSGPTTPESDKWRRDSQALVSSEAESFSDSAKDHQKSPEKDVGCSRVPSTSTYADTEVKKDEFTDNKMAENELEVSNETKNKTEEPVRPSGKTKLIRSNRAVDEETSEKGVATNEIVLKDEVVQSVEESECSKPKASLSNSPSKQPSSSPPSTSPVTSPQQNQHVSPRTSPSNCRRKENLEIANLTKKVSMKQEEVLQSAEEVLSSANQLSDIQACVEELECRMDTLEKSVVGSFSAESGSDEEGPSSQNALSPQEQVAEDVQILEKQLAEAQQVDRQTEENSATAVRLITATALKVLSTTENIIESEHAHWSASSVRPDLNSDDDKEDSHHSGDGDHGDKEEENDVSVSASKSQEACADDNLPSDELYEGEDCEIAAIERANEERRVTSLRPSTEGMHLDLDGTGKREPTTDGCADQADVSPSSQGAQCPSPEAQRSSSRQHSYSPYGGTGSSILHIDTQEGAPPVATLMCDTEEDVQNGNGLGATYETPTASSRPPVPNVRCLPTGSSQEDEAVEEKTDSPRASPVGQEDAVQAALYEDIAELEEKVYLSAGKVFTLEERLHQLEHQVDKIDRCSPEDVISDLEDSIALTMAQVAQSESQVMSVEEQIALLSQSRPMYSSTQVIDCPAKGSTPPHHQGVSLATLNMDSSGDMSQEGESTDADKKKKFTSVRKRVALYEMHIGGSGSSTELEPRSPTRTDSASTDLHNTQEVQTQQAKLVS